VKYLGIVALYDLSKICNIITLRGHCYDEKIAIVDLNGKILLDNIKNHTTDETLFERNINDIRENMVSGKSGTYQFIWQGEKMFTAYVPLQVEGLYLFSFSTQDFIDARDGRFITLSILLWFLILLLPCLMMIYVTKNSRKMRKDLEELAYRDHITKGMNVNYFNEVASSAIKAMESPYALVLTNIINFNIYNEKFGYMKGDKVIRQLFLGICKYIEEDEFICRTYADHMMILLKYQTEQRLEERLVEVSKCIMGTSFKLEFGICVIRDATMELEVAKERSILALNSGKKRISEYAAWAFYGLELVEKISFEKELENTMYKAFRRGEFKIYIEPRYELEKRAVCSGDAYVVWKHPDKGILEPDLFMDIFERRDLVICLDTYIFEEICKKIRIHMDEGGDVMPVCLKLHKSNVNITNSIDKFKRIKNRYEIPGKYLEFEITEEIFYEKMDTIGGLIDSIHSMECTCTMGNFGGGYLALNVLQKINIDGIKLDKSWMKLPMPQKMVDAMVEIGKAMGVKTVATGITKEAQVRYLQKCYCDEGTGNVFSKTMTLEEYINIF
jgi:diguanylate cyclase (GGDEF)-like protein